MARFDGLYTPWVSWDAWATVVAYEAETADGREFVRLQSRKFLPKTRRVVHRPPDDAP